MCRGKGKRCGFDNARINLPSGSPQDGRWEQPGPALLRDVVKLNASGSMSVSQTQSLAVSRLLSVLGERCWLIARADDITHLSMAGGEGPRGPGVAP
jgi:hypothetical protein